MQEVVHRRIENRRAAESRHVDEAVLGVGVAPGEHDARTRSEGTRVLAGMHSHVEFPLNSHAAHFPAGGAIFAAQVAPKLAG